MTLHPEFIPQLLFRTRLLAVGTLIHAICRWMTLHLEFVPRSLSRPSLTAVGKLIYAICRLFGIVAPPLMSGSSAITEGLEILLVERLGWADPASLTLTTSLSSRKVFHLFFIILSIANRLHEYSIDA